MQLLKDLHQKVRLSDSTANGGFLPLFLVSFSALYVEIVLIRWVGTEFRLFAYFQNLALIACFLGFGYGCLRSRKKPERLFDYVALSALVILIDIPWRNWSSVLEIIGAGLSGSTDVSVWQGVSGKAVDAQSFIVSTMFVTGVLLLLVATMIPLGSWVGRYLESASNSVAAYSVNLVGSLFGVWFFAGISFLHLSPVYWFGLAFLLALVMQPAWRRPEVFAALVMGVSIVLLALGRLPAGKTVWSPYQKLEVVAAGNQNYDVRVNNAGYMTIANLSAQELAKDPELAKYYREESSYETPYRFVGKLDSVLIVGSGAGNDVAAAVRHDAKSVDAVEIDPVIYNFGRTLHPENPYGSANVHVTIDDARDFIRRTDHRYDLILFALLDSHTQYSSLSSMRIDNYVYTQQAFEEARRLLKPNGILVVKFEVLPTFDWLGQRFYGQLKAVFGRAPIVYYNPQIYALLPATVFIASNTEASWTSAEASSLADFLQRHPPRFAVETNPPVPLTTDDWPYIYQRARTIPRIYLVVSLILLGLALSLIRRTFAYRQPSTWHFFLLGAGFLLLETQLVSRLALFFGSTWIVNCVALTFILLVLLVANLFVMKAAVKHLAPHYVLLILSLVAVYLTEWTHLPFFSRTVGILLCMAYSLPLFFAGVVFTESFRRARGDSGNFGANILGAVAGGLAQNLSFIIGVKALLLIAAIFYVTAGILNLFADRPTPVPATSFVNR
jgi:spermidine synthase